MGLRERTGYPRFGLGMNDRVAVEQFRQLVNPAMNLLTNVSASGSQYWYVQQEGRSAVRTLAAFLPHLGDNDKQERALEAIAARL